MLGWLVERGIDPHVPVWDKSRRNDYTFSRADFIYDDERDVYTCPNGKTLKTTGRALSDNALRYLANKHDCEVCSIKPKCCPRTQYR